MRRRDLLSGLMLAGCTRSRLSPSHADARSSGAPEARWGVQSGDVSTSSAVVWSRADRASRLVVERSLSPRFDGASRVVGPLATADTDFTAKVLLDGLAPGSRIHYRARFEGERASDWVVGAFSTAPVDARDVVFAWSADVNGQGWGIDPSRGGMPAFRALLERAPDFFVCCGDAIYADNPIAPEIALPDGGVWKNVVTDAKSHAASTLDDFRGAFLYPRHSPEVRALSAAVPTFSVWDDHEVENNWWPGKRDAVDRAAAFARRAMHEHAPTRRDPSAPMYRSVRWGPHLELFLVDGRTYRSANFPALGDVRFFGAAQLAWLGDAIARSTATWKVVACDMPLGVVVPEPDGRGGEAYDGIANVAGPPREREIELARLLASLAEQHVENVVWITGDIHYAAAHRYDPTRAAFKPFSPFWEFVAGPMHATAFPRKRLDDTFGPELAFASADADTFGSPATGAQFFGVVRIDGSTRTMTVTLVDARGRDLHVTVLRPGAA